MLASETERLLAQAKSLNIATTATIITDSLGGLEGNVSNINNFYQFSLAARSNFNLTLNGLTADCDVQLIQDANNNLDIDKDEVIAWSTKGGVEAESIKKTLNPGTYYIRVFPYQDAASNYNLTFAATPVDDAGNNLNTARNIGVSAIASTYSDWVGSADTDDYYSFSLGSTSNFNLYVNNLSNNVGVELLNNNGEVVGSANSNGITSEPITYTLDTGTYYVRIYTSSGDTFYNLNVSTTPTTSYTLPTLTSSTPPQVTDAGSTPLSSGSVNIVSGTLRADTFSLQSNFSRTVFSGNGNVDYGQGLRDLLDLSSIISTTAQFNYANTTTGGVLFNPGNGTRLFDAITLSDGREILFESIERIAFADTAIDLSVTPNDPLFNQQWNLHMSGVHNAWRLTTGSNQVLVGITDSGLGVDSNGNLHSDLRATTTTTISNNYRDELSTSHGTSVQGIIAAASNNGVGMSGINWNSPVYHVDVIASTTGGDAGDYSLSRAIQAMINQANANGQRLIVNMSLAGGSSLALENLIQQNQNNALFVIAAGNSDANTIASPADLAQKYKNVMAVGAVWGTKDYYGKAKNPGERITYNNWWGSARGEGLTIMAASEVYTTNATRKADGSYDFGYNSLFNGTSAAVPNVTGVASLMWSVNPSLSATNIRKIIENTAYDLGAAGYDTTYGSGFINADAAVRRALAIARQAQTPGSDPDDDDDDDDVTG